MPPPPYNVDPIFNSTPVLLILIMGVLPGFGGESSLLDDALLMNGVDSGEHSGRNPPGVFGSP